MGWRGFGAAGNVITDCRRFSLFALAPNELLPRSQGGLSPIAGLLHGGIPCQNSSASAAPALLTLLVPPNSLFPHFGMQPRSSPSVGCVQGGSTACTGHFSQKTATGQEESAWSCTSEVQIRYWGIILHPGQWWSPHPQSCVHMEQRWLGSAGEWWDSVPEHFPASVIPWICDLHTGHQSCALSWKTGGIQHPSAPLDPRFCSAQAQVCILQG